MKRHSESKLWAWYHRNNRKPLVIRGARQVGKSTLVRQFAAQNKIDLFEVNLERYPALEPVFKTLDMSRIVKEIESILGVAFLKKKGILFLDEIQATPSALAALRYFYEEYPDCPVVCAGSLLEFALKDHSFSMPVGRIEYFYLGPMSFTEFLMAMNEMHLIDALSQFSWDGYFPEILHQKCLDRFREYLAVGGMPEAVLIFSETKSLTEVQRVHLSIISTFQDDFAKYTLSPTVLERVKLLFQYVPRHIGEKVKYSNISREDRSKDIKSAIRLLSHAKLLSEILHSSASGVPLAAEADPKVYKLLFLDVGLMNSICGIEWSDINKLDNMALVNKGGIAEQFVGQHLLYRKRGEWPPELYYWVREGKKNNAEVDYVMALNHVIFPIEVKSGKSGTLKSLQQFSLVKSCSKAIRFDLNPPSKIRTSNETMVGQTKTRSDLTLISVPLYMVEELERLIVAS